MAWQIEYPVLTTWLDLRPWHGVEMSSNSGWTFNTSVSFCYTPYYLYANAIWTNSSKKIVNTASPAPYRNYFCYKGSTANANSNWTAFYTGYGLNYNNTSPGGGFPTGYWLWRNPSNTNPSCIFLPSRPLATCPIETFDSTASVVTSLSGVTYKTSYGHHKTWNVSLYLDGYLDANRPDYYWDARTAFDNWLKFADIGVTLTLQRRESTTFYSRSRRTAAPYIDCPTNICGQLEQSNLRFEGADEHCYRYKLDLTIHEAKGTNLYE